MSVTGATGRVLGKVVKLGAKAVKNKAVEATQMRAERFKQDHPHLVKGGQLTKAGWQALANTMKYSGCPCGCGKKSAVPDHVKGML